MLFNLSDAWAQSAESRTAEGQTEIKPLQIGDTIPEELWHMPLQVVNHPEGKDTITLNDYRDKKLIILDFMHTRCKGCTDKLKELDTLQKIFSCTIKFVLMSPEKKSEMESFLKYRPMSTFYSFPLTFIDQTVADYIRYRFISHFVWVYRGKIVAITGGNEVADDNLKKLLNTGNINLPVKNDFEGEEGI
ncbi:peroxiredoxin family protein [Sphingobacterium phlebotomi]|nr:redoxin domain-containing protein [Sphingobacterium phlebotomi]